MIKLTPQLEDSIIGQALRLKSSISYFNENTAPHIETMEKWEAKEYTEVNDDAKAKLEEIKSSLKENEKFWNEELAMLKMSVVVFIAKYL